MVLSRNSHSTLGLFDEILIQLFAYYISHDLSDLIDQIFNSVNFLW